MSGKRLVTEYARLEARISSAQKELIQQAANLEGRSLTDYIVDSATTAAQQTIEKHQILRLTERGTEAFFAAIESPPEPSPRLRAAAQRYRKLFPRTSSSPAEDSGDTPNPPS